MKKLKICFIGTSPNFDGGVSVLQKNLISYIKKIKAPYEITWVYPGKGNRSYTREGVNYTELKVPKTLFLEDILFSIKVSGLLKRRDFDIINCHGIWGPGIGNYGKKTNQKFIQTYHGTAYNLLKNSSKRFGLLKKITFLPVIFFGYLMEKLPLKNADRIICVSEKVKKEVQEIYGKIEDVSVIRTGVDLEKFKIIEKNKAKIKVGLEKKKVYGLYVGHGGFWTKGLDRAVNLSEELYKKDSNYRLVVIGPEIKKVKHLIDRNFVIYLKNVNRGDMPFYYNSSDIFFCMSRYEGGAPTLVVSEAMGSGCLIAFSKSSEQEIIEDGKNGIILQDFSKSGAEKIMEFLKNKKQKERIIKNSRKTIKDLSLKKWGERYLDVLTKY